MNIGRCPVCKETLYDWKGHTCKPSFECIEIYDGEKWDPEDFDETSVYHIFEDNARKAAETFWARRCSHAADYHSGQVYVRPTGTGPEAWMRYEVEVEAVPEYTASLVKPKDKPKEF